MFLTALTKSSNSVAIMRAHAIAQDLGYGPAGARDNRRTTGERLDHREAKRLRPVDGEHQGERVAEEFVLLRFVDLADVLDVRATTNAA